jgi:hypothetical protein
MRIRMLAAVAAGAAAALAGCSTLAMDSTYIGTLASDDGMVTATAYETLTAGVVCCGFRMQVRNQHPTDICVYAYGGGGGRNTTLVRAGETKDVLWTDSTGWVSGSYGFRSWDPRTAPCVGMGPG